MQVKRGAREGDRPAFVWFRTHDPARIPALEPCFAWTAGIRARRPERLVGFLGEPITGSRNRRLRAYPTSASSESWRVPAWPFWSVSSVGYSPVKQWSVNWGLMSSRPS